ncbi:MAG: gliding motility protein GldN [Muribaculaceae bacterium]|nr:gliding motility protein GldN [Muribaculaceae bacterium]
MKHSKKILSLALFALIAAGAIAQVESGGGVRRRSERDKKKTEAANGQVTPRMQDFYVEKSAHDADIEYMRKIYRQIDLTKDANTPLYFPEDVVDGQENLFRLMLRLVCDGSIPAYEYLDGREVFTDQYRVNVPEMLDRYDIYYQQSGSGKNAKVTIEEADVPTGQVLNYYILEKWEFDRRSNQMKTRVEAICPVLNKIGDFGGDTRYPMFWVKFDALRPFLANQYIFLTDDNNLPTYSLDDYFNLGMYDGEIYKTQNLRNLSMNQMYPDEDELKQAQDSIDRRLREYGKHLWVPTREEYLAQKEREQAAKEGKLVGDDGEPILNVVEDSTPVEQKRESTKKRAVKKKRSTAKPKSSGSSSSGNSNAAKSVRRRKK